MSMNPESSGSLEEQVHALTTRVWQLEKALRANGIAFDQAETAPVAEPDAPTSASPITAPSVNALGTSEVLYTPPTAPFPAFTNSDPIFRSIEPPSKKQAISLETRIGSQWFNRLGILAMLIGVAWFLKLAFDNHWIGPLGRVIIGLAGGTALIVWSERFLKRGFSAFSYSLKAIGSGTLYLSLWAAFSVYALIPAWAAFGAMILVTAFNGYMAWIQDAELLALYAIAGCLSTPVLVSTGGNHEITLFTYLLMMDLAVLVLIALRPWSRLLFVSFVGTVLFIFGWWLEFYSFWQAGRTALYLACFFLIFAFAPRLARMRLDPSGALSPWDQLALTAMPLINAALGFIAFYFLFTPATEEWAGPWIAVAFAAFYLTMLRLPARGALRASSSLLSGLHLSAAVVFLTIAIPLKAHGRWLTVGWLVEGAALLWVASRVQSILLRALALVCFMLGLGALLFVNPPASLTPFLNQRFATFVVAVAACAFAGWIAYRSHDERVPEPPLNWPSIAACSALAVNLLTLLAVGWEIHSFWWARLWHGGDWQQMSEYRMYAQFTYSAFFMAYGAALLSVGFWRRSAFLRWQALVLLAFSIAKVFLADVSQLSRGFRILSFLGLGALLLAISFVYQRDWLNLRGSDDQAS